MLIINGLIISSWHELIVANYMGLLDAEIIAVYKIERAERTSEEIKEQKE